MKLFIYFHCTLKVNVFTTKLHFKWYYCNIKLQTYREMISKDIKNNFI